MLELDRNAFFRSIRASDFANAKPGDVSALKETLANDAYQIARTDFSRLKLRTIKIKNNDAYSIQSLPHEIVLRRLNVILKIATNIKPADRDTVVRSLATILTEGVPHRVYKFDIKSFFESLDTKQLMGAINSDRRIPRGASLLLSRYLSHLALIGVNGVPRGIPLSATLAEYALQAFDAAISRLGEIYYYARYVDDIVIVTGARELQKPFSQAIRRLLPYSLDFNPAKTKLLNIPVQQKSSGISIIGDFDYLGYNIAVHESTRVNKKLVRSVDVTIAPKKIKRLKARLCCAMANFTSTKDITLLRRRMQLLTGNYNIREAASGRVRNVGLYCNYRRINVLGPLVELDQFLRSVVVGNRSRLAKRIAAILPLGERRALLSFSFATTFKGRTFYNFRPSELAQLTRCWRDV